MYHLIENISFQNNSIIEKLLLILSLTSVLLLYTDGPGSL
jgi:hypothetical protein